MFKKLCILIVGLSTGWASAADHSITQKDKNFSQTSMTVSKGDSISFHNAEKDITHNVYSLGPKNPFELKTQPPGQTSSVTFNEAGETNVECAIHPTMKLKVTVK